MAATLVLLSKANFHTSMTSNAPFKPIGSRILRDALELIAVTMLVFAIGWCVTRLAEAAHVLPVGPAHDGGITLRIAKSDRHGDVKFEEGQDFTGWWHCMGEWTVAWRLAPKSARLYHIWVRVSNPARQAERQIQVEINNRLLTAEIPNTGNPSNWKWKDMDLGTAPLEAKPYSLNVQSKNFGRSDSLNLKWVILRPELASPSN